VREKSYGESDMDGTSAKQTQFLDCGLGTDLLRDAGPAACCLGPARGGFTNKANSRRRVGRGQQDEGQLCETNPICPDAPGNGRGWPGPETTKCAKQTQSPPCRVAGANRSRRTKPIWPAEIPQHSSIPLFQHSNRMPATPASGITTGIGFTGGVGRIILGIGPVCGV